MQRKLRIVYYGTPDFSAEFLEMLLGDEEIPVTVTRVITQEPKKAGRRQIITVSDVEKAARQRGIPVSYDVSDIPDGTDLALLFVYGKLIPRQVLERPTHGFWNIHPSLLPLYRGPAPVAGPIFAGDAVTGVTLIQLDDQMDHGPIIAQAEYPIGEDDRRDGLSSALARLGYTVFKNTVLANSGNIREIKSIPQDHARATYTKLMTKADGFITDLDDPILYRKFRALYPWPGLWTYVWIEGVRKRLKITGVGGSGVTHVQLEGKKTVDYDTYVKAYGTPVLDTEE